MEDEVFGDFVCLVVATVRSLVRLSVVVVLAGAEGGGVRRRREVDVPVKVCVDTVRAWRESTGAGVKAGVVVLRPGLWGLIWLVSVAVLVRVSDSVRVLRFEVNEGPGPVLGGSVFCRVKWGGRGKPPTLSRCFFGTEEAVSTPKIDGLRPRISPV